MFEPAEPVGEAGSDVLPGQPGRWGYRKATVDQDQAGHPVGVAIGQVHGDESTHRHATDVDRVQAGRVEDEREIVGVPVHAERAGDPDAVGPAAQIGRE